MIVTLLLISEYKKGVRSSGPPVILWVGLVVYGSIKMWTVLAKAHVVSYTSDTTNTSNIK